MKLADFAVAAGLLALVAVLHRIGRRRDQRKPRYHVVRELDPGWHEVRAVLRHRPDPEIDRLIKRSQNGEGRA